jgi:hypothetical protein
MQQKKLNSRKELAAISASINVMPFVPWMQKSAFWIGEREATDIRPGRGFYSK